MKKVDSKLGQNRTLASSSDILASNTATIKIVNHYVADTYYGTIGNIDLTIKNYQCRINDAESAGQTNEAFRVYEKQTALYDEALKYLGSKALYTPDSFENADYINRLEDSKRGVLGGAFRKDAKGILDFDAVMQDKEIKDLISSRVIINSPDDLKRVADAIRPCDKKEIEDKLTWYKLEKDVYSEKRHELDHQDQKKQDKEELLIKARITKNIEAALKYNEDSKKEDDANENLIAVLDEHQSRKFVYDAFSSIYKILRSSNEIKWFLSKTDAQGGTFKRFVDMVNDNVYYIKVTVMLSAAAGMYHITGSPAIIYSALSNLGSQNAGVSGTIATYLGNTLGYDDIW